MIKKEVHLRLETDRELQMQVAGKCCLVDMKILLDSSCGRHAVLDEIEKILIRLYDQLEDDMADIIAGVEHTSGDRLEIREVD